MAGLLWTFRIRFAQIRLARVIVQQRAGMRNPHFISRPGRVDQCGLNVEQKLRATGSNTGNLLFISALQRVVAHDRLSCKVGFRPREIRADHDGLIIPAANWLDPTSVSLDFENLAGRIEASGLPCVLIGLGARALSEDQPLKLQPGMMRLLAVVSERSKSISVRGEFSAHVLEAHGFKNVVVTGCPSLLWWVDRPAHASKKVARPSRITINGTRGEFDESAFGATYAIGLKLARLARRISADYVAQTELPDMYFGLQGFTREDVDLQERALAFVKRIYDEPDELALLGFLSAHVKTFFDVDEWIAYLRGRDFVIGTRLHGVIAALLAGTPGVLITHDTRTREMARTLSIPAIGADALGEGGGALQRIYDETDLSAFNAAQPKYVETFRQFFEDNGVAHRLPGVPDSSSTSRSGDQSNLGAGPSHAP